MIGAGVPGGADQLPPQDGGQAGGALPHVLARRPGRRRSDTELNLMIFRTVQVLRNL